MELMEVVRRPVVHGVKLYLGGKEAMTGSLCVSAYYLLYSTRRHEGQDEITVSPPYRYVVVPVKDRANFQMLTTAVEGVEHKVNSPVLLIILKDFRHLVLEFPGPEEAQDMADALHHLSRPGLNERKSL